MTPEKHLVYCRIERTGAVLLLRREAGTFLGGSWELPGGTVEAGEPPEAAAVREVAEETGLAVSVGREVGRFSWMDVTGRDLRVHATVYMAHETESAEVVLNPAEHDAHAWLRPAEAVRLGLAAHFLQSVSTPG
ncbi:NUDIX domain-containing protein [Prauserella cavernicola]|uniref:NUDIX hydrolase n=1 Tax=Prauserella cavernicola TaxID=2800127 RepID=A0A934QT76_9PSEU|nr:NUDIX hydrolase [Prauserella cavernicola]MBK1785806.1 NUDIX hydrolase [Prauserella cavernicola]